MFNFWSIANAWLSISIKRKNIFSLRICNFYAKRTQIIQQFLQILKFCFQTVKFGLQIFQIEVLTIGKREHERFVQLHTFTWLEPDVDIGVVKNINFNWKHQKWSFKGIVSDVSIHKRITQKQFITPSLFFKLINFSLKCDQIFDFLFHSLFGSFAFLAVKLLLFFVVRKCRLRKFFVHLVCFQNFRFRFFSNQRKRQGFSAPQKFQKLTSQILVGIQNSAHIITIFLCKIFQKKASIFSAYFNQTFLIICIYAFHNILFVIIIT